MAKRGDKWLQALKSKLSSRSNRHRKPSNNDFIIQHSKNNQCNDIHFLQSPDSRRVVFVSLIGVYQTWLSIPNLVLFASIFLIPLKRKWIYDTEKYKPELQSHFISRLSMLSETNSADTDSFWEMIKWKDSQNLVFWMLDDPESKTAKAQNNEVFIHPFWLFFNHKLQTLKDSVTGQKYNGLNLDSESWANIKTKYTDSHKAVLSELYFLEMKFKSISEILYQSNPHSLNPVQSYSASAVKGIMYDLELSDVEDRDDWFISRDYNPDELD